MTKKTKVTSEKCIKSLLRFLKTNRGPYIINSNWEVGCILTKQIKEKQKKSQVERVKFQLKKTKPIYSKYSFVIFYEIDEENFYTDVLSSDDEIVLIIPASREIVVQVFSLIK